MKIAFMIADTIIMLNPIPNPKLSEKYRVATLLNSSSSSYSWMGEKLPICWRKSGTSVTGFGLSAIMVFKKSPVSGWVRL